MPNSSSSPNVFELLARRGINPNHSIDPEPPFDPIAWRLEHYGALLAAEVPVTFASAQPDHPQVRAWLERHIADPATDPWLVLSGNTGTGKTHLAYGVLRHLVGIAARANRNYRWLVVTHPDLNAMLRPKPDESHTYALDRYLEVDFLILDDVGAGKGSGFTEENITRLVDYRWSNRLATVYTTNLDADSLEPIVGERVLSRLADATLVELDGPDRRFNREIPA
ncbi:ATP-binding protein [Micromonospora sp. NPDC048986]|uniref:ATP-binding protein n=1 Tax=Micromonospora sp. NPDC048986 TaxID=3155644 RepID=UPI0033D89602